MLIAITLALRPEADVTLPGHLGRASYAAMLDRLQVLDPALVQSIHDGDGPKPLTCSSLLNVRAGRPSVDLRAGERYYIRVTGLTPAVSAALARCLLEDRPASWQLDHCALAVDETICDPATDAWSGQTTYEALAAAQLTRPDPAERTVRLQFASPTAFRSNNVTVPLPLPGLVFGSLVERWNAFSPVTLSPEMRRYGEEVMAISAYRLQSVALPQKGDSLRIGGMGEVTYRALGGDRYWLGVMHMLAEFARFSGVGVQTTGGMGQVRKLAR